MPFFGNIGAPELIIILVIALIVLGPGKLPDVAQSLGKSVREFRRAATDLQDATKLEPGPSGATPAPPTVPAANTLTEGSAPNTLSAPTAPAAAATAPTPAPTNDTDAPAS